MRGWLPIGILVAAGCGFAEAEVAGLERAVPSADATRVEVVTLEASDAVVELDLPGEVGAARDALLAAANGGYVERVRVAAGDLVQQGQTLVQVDDQLYRAQVDQAEAQAEQAAADLARLEQLGDLATASQLDGARTNARVAAAQARQAQVRYRHALVKAPFRGIVADVAVERGESVSPGAPVVRLVQLDPAIVTLSVSDRDVVALVAGTPVEVRTAARPEPVQGVIARIAPAADLRTRSFPVEVEVPNPDGTLLPGMIARVHGERRLAPDAVVVPQDWLITRRSARGVFVTDGDTAQWRDVELGDVIHDDIVITSGIEPGDRVVITGQRELVDGDPLLITRAGTCCSTGRPVFE